MKKLILKCLTVALAVFLFPSKASAHLGNTAPDGCHYCRTNCEAQGEIFNVRHCHGGESTVIEITPVSSSKPSSQPSPTPTPAPIPPLPTPFLTPSPSLIPTFKPKPKFILIFDFLA